jgi:branched-chain amino acid transport system ATP-binding protein
MPLLEVVDVHARYGDSAVLHGVSLAIEPAQVVSLLGRNGMGKSTTVRTIVGAMAPSGGRVVFQGRPTAGESLSTVTARGIGWVPEGRRIFASLTVEENLLVAQRTARRSGNGWGPAQAYALFPRLQERRQHQGNQLSGGEQQMLAIARALTTGPDLLILDEATEGLAPLIRQEIWTALGHLKAAGQSILIIDKHLKAIAALADRHYVMEKGRIVWSGGRRELGAQMDTVRGWLSVAG